MSPRVCHWLTVLGALVVSACGHQEPALPDAALPDAAPDAAPPDAAPPDAIPPDAAPFCGDGVRQDGEECDHQDFGGRTCVDEGYYDGRLACRPECKVDASGCSGRCGDGEINGPERCDDALPLTGTCRSRGFLTGTPFCAPGCVFGGCQNDSSSDGEIVLGGRDETSQLGASLAFAGDVDGDGRADLLAAAPGEVRVLGKKGAVYLIPGSPDGRATINDAARFVDDSWDALGSLVLEVAPARDIDGDGRADFLIAAQTDGLLDVYLVYGRPEPFTGTLKLADLVESGAAARFSIERGLPPSPPAEPAGPLPPDSLRSSIPLTSARMSRRAAIGVPDVTGDGRDDLLLAVPDYGGGLGATFVIPGDPVRYSGTLVLPAPVAPLPLPVHAAIVGSAIDGFLGDDLAAGDLDGDGVADLFVTSGGDVQVFYGPIEGVLSPADAEAHTDLGSVTSLALADLDGDHDAGLFVTTSNGGYLFRGQPSRREGPLLASDADLLLFTTSSSEVLAGGDVDGDGHPELVVTEPSLFHDVGIIAGPIVRTGSLGLELNSLRWQLDVFPASLDFVRVSLGDFNGDGYDDVAVATVKGEFGDDAGVVQIFTGATAPTP
jgi:hypothetical protein